MKYEFVTKDKDVAAKFVEVFNDSKSLKQITGIGTKTFIPDGSDEEQLIETVLQWKANIFVYLYTKIRSIIHKNANIKVKLGWTEI